jgi:hypothetical protein
MTSIRVGRRRRRDDFQAAESVILIRAIEIENKIRNRRRATRNHSHDDASRDRKFFISQYLNPRRDQACGKSAPLLESVTQLDCEANIFLSGNGYAMLPCAIE